MPNGSGIKPTPPTPKSAFLKPVHNRKGVAWWESDAPAHLGDSDVLGSLEPKVEGFGSLESRASGFRGSGFWGLGFRVYRESGKSLAVPKATDLVQSLKP